MALRIIYGDSFDALRQDIAENIVNNGAGRHILLVPDQFTLRIEEEILRLLNIKCTFDIEVLSFSRFARQILGKRVSNMLNQQTGVLLLSKVIHEVKDNLVCYRAVADSAGYATETYAVITNIRNSGVTPEDLERVLPSLNGLTERKTRDILTIYRAYLDKLKEEYTDITGRLERLRDALCDADISSTMFYICDFADISYVKMQVAGELIKYAKSVTVGLADNSGAVNSRIYPQDFKRYLYTLTEEVGIAVETVNSKRRVQGDAAIIRDNLFGYGLTAKRNGSDAIEIYHAADSEAEARHIAQRIKKEVYNGARFKQFAVVAEGNEESIARAFDDFGIAYYIDRKYPLERHAAIRVFKAAVKGTELRAQDMVSLSKELFMGISAFDASQFENYVIKYNINRTQFSRPFILGSEEEIAAAEKVRSRLIRAIEIVKGEKEKVKVSLRRVRDFYSYISLSERLAELRESADRTLSEVTEQVEDRIYNIISQCEEIFGDGEQDCEITYNMLLAGVQSINISTVPLYIDCVYVGDSSSSRYERRDYIFLSGAEQGKYPRDISDGGIVADAECAAWAKQGVVVTGPKNRAAAEKFNILELLLKADKKLIFSTSGQKERSSALKQIERLFLLKPVTVNPYLGYTDRADEDIAYKLGAKDNAIREVLRGVSAEKALNIGANYAYGKFGEDIERYIDRGEEYASDCDSLVFKDNYLSMSGIEKYFSCPYAFYAQYALKLKDRERAEENSMDTGSFVHRVMELFFAEEKEYRLTREQIDVKAGEYVDRVFEEEEFAAILRSGKPETVKANYKERIAFILYHLLSNQRRSAFIPSKTEVAFGMKNSDIPPIRIEVDGEEYFIRGIIDRIDDWGGYSLLLDYKSSEKKFTHNEIYYGGRLQLPVYYSAYCEKFGRKPAGMLYVPLVYKYVNGDKMDKGERLKYSGFVSNDTAALKAIDNEYESSSFLPVKVKSGEIKGDSTLSDEEFAAISEYAKSLIKQAVTDIKNGKLEPTPLRINDSLPCEYCSYGRLCGKKGDLDAVRDAVKVVK